MIIKFKKINNKFFLSSILCLLSVWFVTSFLDSQLFALILNSCLLFYCLDYVSHYTPSCCYKNKIAINFHYSEEQFLINYY